LFAFDTIAKVESLYFKEGVSFIPSGFQTQIEDNFMPPN
jgi:hypothetical protein